MQEIKIPVHIRSSCRNHAIWQSCVAKAARDLIQTEHPEMSKHEVYQRAMRHPMVLGTNLHIHRHTHKADNLKEEDILSIFKKDSAHPLVHSYLSQHMFQQIQQLSQTASAGAEPLPTLTQPGSDNKPWGMADTDSNWPAWVAAGVEWMAYSMHFPFFYKEIDPGTITIPDNQRVLILGDFGTGLNDGTAMLIAILSDPAVSPDLIIHVGDIYYAGMADEVAATVNMFQYAFQVTGKTVPVFSIPGNHEYYSSGAPFFQQILGMNGANGMSQYNQEASFFCLRSSAWQLLGMDTGLNSIQTKTALDLASQNYGPWLNFAEAAWHQNKLQTWTGRNLLFSHHQLFSVSATINQSDQTSFQGPYDSQTYKYLNANLSTVFGPYLPNVAAWFWGHEHSMGIFTNDQNGLSRGRLIGNSGYEEWDQQGSYQTFPDNPNTYMPGVPELGVTNVPFITIQPNPHQGPVNDPLPIDIGISYTNILNHSFAIMQLNDSTATADVSYYQYPLLNALPDNNPADIPPANQLPPIGAPMWSETF